MNSGKFPVGICTAVTFRSANLILCEAGRCCRNHISVHADLLSLVLRHQFPMLGASKRSQGQDKSLDKRGFTSVLDAVGGIHTIALCPSGIPRGCECARTFRGVYVCDFVDFLLNKCHRPSLRTDEYAKNFKFEPRN